MIARISPTELTAPPTPRYNVGVLASVLVHPGFKEALHQPDTSRSGLITAIYYLGTWSSYIFLAHPASDRLGRRNACLTGMTVTCIGQALQASALGPHALAMVVAGRIIAGMGTAIISTSVPLYQRYATVHVLDAARRGGPGISGTNDRCRVRIVAVR